jgi:hypothetical protein
MEAGERGRRWGGSVAVLVSECTLQFRGRTLKGLSHEIDFKNVVENGQILALIRAAAGF